MDADETVESQISEWSKKRPHWQRTVLRRLTTGPPLAQTELEIIADKLIAGRKESAAPLNETEISSAASEEAATITLESVGDITNVNGLIDGETLTFGDTGLTVVYGHNASGKSGYARLIKAVSGALHVEPVHGNVFTDNGDDPQAEIVYRRDREHETVTWPDNGDGDLRAIRFYDEACGNTYIDRESELTYRPSALTLLDALIAVCDEVNSMLDQRLAENDKAKGQLPTPPEASEAEAFIGSLTASTTKKQIDEACRLPGDVDDQRRELSQQEARLRNSDPATECKRLEILADQAEMLSEHIEALIEPLSDAAVTNAITARDKAVELRDAAVFASSEAFSDEPVTGVGTETWRAMWEAARRFSETEAYQDHEFPATDGDARCVLCQQELFSDAAGRLTRFETFVQDQTAKRAAKAETVFEKIRKNLDVLVVKPAEIAADLVTLKADKPKLAKSTIKWLKVAEKRRKATVARISGETDDEPPPLEAEPHEKLDTYADNQRTAAAKIDSAQFNQNLAEVTSKRANLEGRIELAKKKVKVVAEVERLRKRAAIEAAKHETDTAQITRQASTIMNRSITDQVLDRFQTEAQRMGLVQVELTATGGRKGKLQQRPALVDTDTVVPIQQVLCEGEQTALGLAGFFTEAHFDTSESALVFDDPVTSLDHIRRERVADRVVEFAGQRQVVVFTHELAFVIDLTRSAKREGLRVTERRIERVGDTSPGKVGDTYPWKAKDVGSRFNALENELAKIKKNRPSWTNEEYEEACAKWAGRLSETWERLVHLEVISQVFDTATFEVKPMKFRILGRITPRDDDEFQESYGRCSKWASRHDKSPEINYVAPEPAVLEEELKRVREWWKRIKTYR